MNPPGVFVTVSKAHQPPTFSQLHGRVTYVVTQVPSSEDTCASGSVLCSLITDPSFSFCSETYKLCSSVLTSGPEGPHWEH